MIPDDLTTLLLSLKTASVATGIAFLVGLSAAWLMAGPTFRGKTTLDAILLAPLVLPPTVVGFLLLLLIGSRSPIGRTAEELLGSGLLFTWPASVIAAAVVSFPLMYRTARGAFEQIDPLILAVGRTLGASPWRVFSELAIPQAWPGIVAATVLTFARALGEFGATLMIAGNMPGRTQTIPLAIYADVESGDIQHAALWAAVVTVITIILALAGSRLSKCFPQVSKRVPSILPLQYFDTNPKEASPVKQAVNASLSFRIKKELGSFSLDLSYSSVNKSCAILGASGAGKSVLLRCLSGLEMPDAGNITVNGDTLFDAKSAKNIDTARRRIGHVFQNYALFSHMCVFDNVGFGLKSINSSERRMRVMRILGEVGLDSCQSMYPREISGGQQQRVAVARALVTEPGLLLLDEPLSALDSHLKYQMERLLARSVREFRGITLMVTHNLEEAFRICDDLMVLDEGKIIAFGEKHRIFSQPGNVRTAILTGCKNISPIRQISNSNKVIADSWGGVEVLMPATNNEGDEFKSIGIRAHQLIVRGADANNATEINSFPCWLADVNESPHRMSLHLRLTAHSNKSLKESMESHIQAEMPKDEFIALMLAPQPWRVILRSDRLMKLV